MGDDLPDSASFAPPPTPSSSPWGLEEVLDGVTDIIFALNREWQFTFFNRRAEEFFELDAASVLGRKCWEVFPQGWETSFASHMQQAMESGTEHQFEFPSTRKPGLWLEVRVFPSERGITVFSADITERKNSEERARGAYEQLQLIIDGIPASVAYAGADQIYQYNNRTYYEWFGIPAESIPGKHARDVLGPEVYRHVLPYINATLEGKRIDYEAVIPDPSGSFRNVSASYIPDIDADGRVRGYIAIGIDVTERRRNQLLLEEYHRQIETILESMSDAFVAVDVQWRYTYVNARASRMMGHPPIDLIGRELWELYPTMRDTIFERSYRHALETGQPTHFEAYYPDTSRTYEVHVYPSNSGLGIYFRDVSERKTEENKQSSLLDAERAARQDLETINRIKDDFLHTLSHELRTPLNAVLGWCDLLRSDNLDPADLQTGLEVIGRNTRVQAQILGDLLDISRIVSGNVRLELRKGDLREIVQRAIDSMQQAAAARELRIRTYIDPDIDSVTCDPDRLQQIIRNLLSNGIKYTPIRGSIAITAIRLKSQIEIKVTDNGIGIEQELLPNLFTRFGKADSQNPDDNGEGLRLGLTIVKSLTELHGGTVTAASMGPGKGATFTVLLPNEL